MTSALFCSRNSKYEGNCIDYLHTISGENTVGWLGSDRNPWRGPPSTGQYLWVRLSCVSAQCKAGGGSDWQLCAVGWDFYQWKLRIGTSWDRLVVVVMVVMMFNRKWGRSHGKCIVDPVLCYCISWRERLTDRDTEMGKTDRDRETAHLSDHFICWVG